MLNSFTGNVIAGFAPLTEGGASDIDLVVFQAGKKIPAETAVGPIGSGGRAISIKLPESVRPGNGPSIMVKHAGSDMEVAIHPDLLGFANDANDHTNALIHHPLFFREVAHMAPALQVPQPMIDHIGGGSQESYRVVGLAIALDALRFGVIKSVSDSVVDLGCGCGRMAMALSAFLDPAAGGSYDGFDIWADGIAWADANITPLRPHARFHALGQHNAYNARATYRLTVEDASCDAFIATSVFTHLRREAADAYMAEISRILKPGGKAYITFFASKEIYRSYNLPVTPEEDEYGINFVNRQSEDTYVDESVATRMFEVRGLKVLGVKYGTWRGPQFAYRGVAGYQDVFIVKRA